MINFRPNLAWMLALLAVSASLVMPASAGDMIIKGPDYVGSDKCATCHQVQFKGWVKTFHSTVIQDAQRDPSVILGDLSDLDVPFTRDQVFFTIGGHWDQRYLTKLDDEYYILPRLWSIQSKKWRPYSAYGWQKRPYSKYCVGCHSVGFNPQTKKIYEHSVGCESCHGSGTKHVKEPTATNIVNPGHLPKDRSEEICASCHVRGKDLTDEYFFPLGYKPGDDLGKYLVPIDKLEGESNSTAIHRLWDKWRSDREAKARSRCEVCGIDQGTKPKKALETADAMCLSCHEFEDRVQKHTRHKEGSVHCADCHIEKPQEAVNESKSAGVHSYSFFLVHSQNCWDKEINKRCTKCHADKGAKWAYDTFESWKKPVEVDH
jgi:hypothetical protein